MNIDTVKIGNAKRNLRGDLFNCIQTCLQAFEDETGISVQNVDIDFTITTTHTDEYPKYTLSNIRIKLSPDL